MLDSKENNSKKFMFANLNLCYTKMRPENFQVQKVSEENRTKQFYIIVLYPVLNYVTVDLLRGGGNIVK